MEFNELLLARHSVRKYSSKPVDRALLEEMIGEAALAPSSRNSKSSRCLIIDDKATLEKMAGMRDYGSGLLAGAAAAIIVIGDSSKTDLWVDNGAITATYLLLSAANKGLAACWVHINGRPQLKAEPEKGSAEEYLRTFIPFGENERPYCAVAIGWPEPKEQ